MDGRLSSKNRHYICNLTLFISDLQTVNLTLRILFHPDPTLLPSIYTNIGQDYDERILPSIVDEVLKSVVVCVTTQLDLLTVCDCLYIALLAILKLPH